MPASLAKATAEALGPGSIVQAMKSWDRIGTWHLQSPFAAGAKICFQSFFMLMTMKPFCLASS